MKEIILKWIEQRFLNCSILSAEALEEKLNLFADGICEFKVDKNYIASLLNDGELLEKFKFNIDKTYVKSISFMST